MKVNKVAKTLTDKTNKLKSSATCPIKEPIARKNDPNKRGNPIKFTSNPPSAATRMMDASKKRNLDEKGELLNPMKKADKGTGVELKKKSKRSKEDVKMLSTRGSVNITLRNQEQSELRTLPTLLHKQTPTLPLRKNC